MDAVGGAGQAPQPGAQDHLVATEVEVAPGGEHRAGVVAGGGAVAALGAAQPTRLKPYVGDHGVFVGEFDVGYGKSQEVPATD